MSTCFADNPAAYFANTSSTAHRLSRAETEALQLATLRARFAALRDRLPPLAALADAQGIDGIDSIEAVAPLLFPHSIYKSYPERLLIEGDFARLTRWLSRLTANDLSPLEGARFPTMDAWMDAIDRHTAVDIYHSSGTTGRMSFYPRGKHEVLMQIEHAKMTVFEWFDPAKMHYGDWFFTVIWPAHAFGRSMILRAGQLFRMLSVENDADFHPLLPAALSADYQYHILRTQNMLGAGNAFGPVASDYVRARLAEADALQAYVPERTGQLLDVIASKREVQRILIAGGPVNIHSIAAAGLARGMTGMAMPGSVIRTFGGFKNHPTIPTIEADIVRFTGNPDFMNAFGMTELTSGFSMCRERHYHVPPWILPLVLDPETGECLPRQGRQRGRAAFFDLVAQTYWGGVVTADLVDLDWTPCGCGRTSAFMHEAVGRIPESGEQDAHIGCAPRHAVAAALESLREGLPSEMAMA
jgi:hypothetical protein